MLVNILPLLTSISENHCRFVITGSRNINCVYTDDLIRISWGKNEILDLKKHDDLKDKKCLKVSTQILSLFCSLFILTLKTKPSW